MRIKSTKSQISITLILFSGFAVLQFVLGFFLLFSSMIHETPSQDVYLAKFKSLRIETPSDAISGTLSNTQTLASLKSSNHKRPQKTQK